MAGEPLHLRQSYPDLDSLTHGLRVALGVGEGLQVLQRNPMRLPHTFPSEVVTCRLADGRELRLFCKYQKGEGHPSHGHRGGLAREAAVYRQVLMSSSSSAPHFYGTYRNRGGGEIWLVIENIDSRRRVLDTTAPQQPGSGPQAGMMPKAASWLGRFHAEHEMKPYLFREGFLTAYDFDYYNAWARRAALIAARQEIALPWVATVCARATEELMRKLVDPPLTLIHGEFYPANILVRDGVIYPVDWESAAIAAGEIDLAALVEHWPAEIAHRCRDEYVAARYPRGEPPDLELRLEAARLYLHFRWLGEHAGWNMNHRLSWRLEDLRVRSIQLGLLPSPR